MSVDEMVYPSFVVLIMTGAPVWAVDRDLGVVWCSKFVFWSSFIVSEVYFTFFAVNMNVLKAVFAGLGVALMSLFLSWFLYFWHDTFRKRS